jgi:predicted component of type VI protein secretion system
VREDQLSVAAPRLDRLRGLRDALVALKGPLADEPGLQANLQKRLFNEEVDSLVLGKICTPVSHDAGRIFFDEAL